MTSNNKKFTFEWSQASLLVTVIIRLLSLTDVAKKS